MCTISNPLPSSWMFSSSWILLSSSMSSPLQSSWLSWYPRKLPITWLSGKLENTGLMIVSGAFADASADQTCLQTGLQKFCTALCSRIRTQRLHQADYCFLFPICRLHLTCMLQIAFFILRLEMEFSRSHCQHYSFRLLFAEWVFQITY